MRNEKGSALFYGAITIAVVALLFCVYYVIPGIYHVPIPAYAEPTKVHYKYIAVFGGIAVLGVIGALLARLRNSMKLSQSDRISQEQEEQSASMRGR
jgi:hypothetical protein